MAPSTLLYPYGKPAGAPVRRLVRAEGVRVFDDQGGEYIDGMASLWYCHVGHGRREIIDAITAQAESLATYNIFPPWTNATTEAAAERVAQVSPFEDPRVFFCSSGSEAVDTAFKIARAVGQLTGETDRQIIVRRTRGYHGVNMGGTSAQGIAANREGWGDLVPHLVEIDPDDIESAQVFAEHGERIAAVITEPVQGAGGVHPPTDGYLARLRQLCDANGSLLIFDEVICGFGRTGSWFSAETFGVQLDLITFAKGVTSGYQPVGGVLVGPAARQVLEADPDYMFRHGYTYSGHPMGAAAVVANIDVIEADGLVERATHVGARLSAGLDALKGDGLVTEVRGVGAIWGTRLAEGTTPERCYAVRDAMYDAGVIARGVEDSILFCPPLIMDDADIDQMVDVLAEVAATVPVEGA